jgi:hypothetical protein
VWFLEGSVGGGKNEIHQAVFRDIYLMYISIRIQVSDCSREFNSPEEVAEA